MTEAGFDIDQLHVRVYQTATEMGAAAASDVARQLRSLLSLKESVRAVFAAAASQEPFIDALVREGGIDWGRIEVLQLDEYVGLRGDDPASLRRWLETHLTERVSLGRVEFMDGTAQDLAGECARYQAIIQSGPIDLGVVGVGENGHLAFNDPHVADFADPCSVKVVEVDDTSRLQQVHDGAFSDVAAVPRRALTLTISSIRAIHTLSVVVPGRVKAAAVAAALAGPVTPRCPASILRSHSAATLYVDADAFAGAKNRIGPSGG